MFLWNDERSRSVAGGAIMHPEDEIVRMACRDFRKKDRERGGIHVRQNQRVEFAVGWTDGSVGIRVLTDDLAMRDRSRPWRTPATVRIGDPSEASLILEHQPEMAPREESGNLPPCNDCGGKRP